MPAGNGQSTNHCRQGQDIQHARPHLGKQQAESEHRDGGHREGALIKAERTRLQLHADAEVQAAGKRDQRGDGCQRGDRPGDGIVRVGFMGRFGSAGHGEFSAGSV